MRCFFAMKAKRNSVYLASIIKKKLKNSCPEGKIKETILFIFTDLLIGKSIVLRIEVKILKMLIELFDVGKGSEEILWTILYELRLKFVRLVVYFVMPLNSSQTTKHCRLLG